MHITMSSYNGNFIDGFYYFLNNQEIKFANYKTIDYKFYCYFITQ